MNDARARRLLIAWFGTTFAERTAAVDRGAGKIEWLDVGTRVAWSEIVAKADEFGVRGNIVDLRQWWHEVTK